MHRSSLALHSDILSSENIWIYFSRPSTLDNAAFNLDSKSSFWEESSSNCGWMSLFLADESEDGTGF